MSRELGDHRCGARAVPSVRGLGALVLLTWLAGCESGIRQVPASGDVEDGNRDPSVTTVVGKTSGEPNGAFADAIVAVFNSAGVASLQGTVAAVGDLDVFLLGAMDPGDKMIVDTQTAGSPLDVSVAIFDADGRLVYNNDDRGGSTDRFFDSYIEWVVRRAGDPYYLVVTHSAFAASRAVTGTYTVDVRVSGGFDVPAPSGQTLLLDFDGAEVTSEPLGPVVLGSFDAASISPIYQGETDAIVETIRAVFEQNFERFNITIRTTDDPPVAEGTGVSTVFFGGFDRSAFAIADDVDLYNVDRCDDALIFTESFQPVVFSNTPTAVELGIAIGNVGSHEAGHLLGLNHVDDDRALMDDQSAADAFIEDQEFMEAPLSRDIMPIGTQNAVMLLDETVGPASAGIAKMIFAVRPRDALLSRPPLLGETATRGRR